MKCLIAVLAMLLWAGAAHAQGYQCRTSPVGGSNPIPSTAYCASEAMVSDHFPTSSTSGHIATFADSSGQVLQDGGVLPAAGVTSLGGATGALDAPSSISSGRALTNSDCENPLLLGNNTMFTMTVNAPSSYTCDRFKLHNVDVYSGASSGRGKLISATLQSGITSFWLMPDQSVELIADGSSAWKADREIISIDGVGYIPRWKTPAVWTGYVNTGGSASDTTQDGLADGASGAGSFKTINHCLKVLYQLLDTQNNQPNCAPKGGQTFSENNLLVQGQPVGTNAFFINGNGSAFTWNATANCIQIADGAEVIFENVNLNCNSSNANNIGHLFLHQAVIIDVFPGVTCTGGGASDSCIICDSNCRVNITQGITLTGTFADFTRALGSHASFNISNVIIASALTIGQIYTLAAPLGGVSTSATYSGTFTGARQYAILNNSVLCNTGGVIPGSAGITTSAGYANGFVASNCN